MLLLAASCNSQQANNGNAPSPAPVATQNSTNQSQPQTGQPSGQPAFNLIKLPILAQNNSGESGSAAIFDVNGYAKVIVTLAGVPANAVQPAHIHFGSCAQLGAIEYPLTNVGNGVFETTLPVSLAALALQPFAINAHKSAAEIGVYVACGDSTKMVESVSTDPSNGAQ